jgi:hypothetical protein
MEQNLGKYVRHTSVYCVQLTTAATIQSLISNQVGKIALSPHFMASHTFGSRKKIIAQCGQKILFVA